MAEILHGLDALARLAAAGTVHVLCATHRLTRQLRQAHGRAQRAAGLSRWPALETATVSQWCAARVRESLLAGELPAALVPRLLLSPLQERELWEEAIRAEEGAGGDFYDRAGLAATAAEAHALSEAWQLSLPGEAADGDGETARFLVWRERFLRRCAEERWLEPVRALAWQIDAIARGAGRLPATVAFAGFDRLPPQEAKLGRVLAERGVRVLILRLEGETPGSATVRRCADRTDECRAAADWAARWLRERPDARLAIVAPELGAVRERLADLLDAALLPVALRAAHAESVRPYDFSLGTPLARQALVRTALELLLLATARGAIEQSRIGELLRGPYWSATAEADARHRLEALLRERLPPQLTLSRLLRFVRRAQDAEHGLATPRLLQHLEHLAALPARDRPARQSPSRWARLFADLLAAAGWPGERPLSSREWQMRRAFDEALEKLAELDAVLGKVGAGETAQRLARLCGETIFQAEAVAAPAVQVLGLLEAAAEPLDGLWVMGMNEHLWPPPPRPNPLLPAELQRRAGTPNASAEVQLDFARAVQRRLLSSASRVVLSYAASEEDRELRPSPLLAGLPAPEAAPVADFLDALATAAPLEAVDDSRAPPVGPGEKVGGGTGLLKAQAICPAWAFYRYRLGAPALAEPVEGLDAKGRGTLLHAVLERFWQGRGQADLLALDAAGRARALAAAVAEGIAAFDAARDEPLPPRFLMLEAERLQRLLGQWLEIEASRPAPFTVVDCERKVELEIEGIAVRLVIDRIDALEDGRLLILDYKTGRASAASWAETRISEPQLPIYAALVGGGTLGGEVAGAAFARVRLDECGFVGIAAEGGLLPRVAGIEEEAARKLFPELSRWPDLLAHWRTAIAAVAREIGAGDAAVRFTDEKELAWCEVLPILRLAERREQMEWLA